MTGNCFTRWNVIQKPKVQQLSSDRLDDRSLHRGISRTVKRKNVDTDGSKLSVSHDQGSDHRVRPRKTSVDVISNDVLQKLEEIRTAIAGVSAEIDQQRLLFGEIREKREFDTDEAVSEMKRKHENRINSYEIEQNRLICQLEAEWQQRSKEMTEAYRRRSAEIKKKHRFTSKVNVMQNGSEFKRKTGAMKGCLGNAGAEIRRHKAVFMRSLCEFRDRLAMVSAPMSDDMKRFIDIAVSLEHARTRIANRNGETENICNEARDVRCSFQAVINARQAEIEAERESADEEIYLLNIKLHDELKSSKKRNENERTLVSPKSQKSEVVLRMSEEIADLESMRLDLRQSSHQKIELRQLEHHLDVDKERQLFQEKIERYCCLDGELKRLVSEMNDDISAHSLEMASMDIELPEDVACSETHVIPQINEEPFTYSIHKVQGELDCEYEARLQTLKSGHKAALEAVITSASTGAIDEARREYEQCRRMLTDELNSIVVPSEFDDGNEQMTELEQQRADAIALRSEENDELVKKWEDRTEAERKRHKCETRPSVVFRDCCVQDELEDKKRVIAGLSSEITTLIDELDWLKEVRIDCVPLNPSECTECDIHDKLDLVKQNSDVRIMMARQSAIEIQRCLRLKLNNQVMLSEAAISAERVKHDDQESCFRQQLADIGRQLRDMRDFMNPGYADMEMHHKESLVHLTTRHQDKLDAIRMEIELARQEAESDRFGFERATVSRPSHSDRMTMIEQLERHLAITTTQLSSVCRDLTRFKQWFTQQESEYNARFGGNRSIASVKSTTRNRRPSPLTGVRLLHNSRKL